MQKGRQYVVKADGVRGATGIVMMNWRLEPSEGGEVAGPTVVEAKEGRLVMRRKVPAGRYRIEWTENLIDWTLVKESDIATGGLEYSEAIERNWRFFRALKK